MDREPEPVWKDNLRSALAENGMTMHALSLKLGKNQHYITQLLNRPHSPNVETLSAIASALGVDLQALIDTDGKPGPGSSPDTAGPNCFGFPEDTADLFEGWFERLIEAINASGQTQRQISIASGLSVNYVNQMVNEGARPTVDKFLAVCAVLQRDPLEILTGTASAERSLVSALVVQSLTHDQLIALVEFIRRLR